MNAAKQKLTLDQSAIYEIKVQGQFDKSWFIWTGKKDLTVEYNDTVSPITILTGPFDQAALHGLLRKIYTLGLPIISVICVEE